MSSFAKVFAKNRFVVVLSFLWVRHSQCLINSFFNMYSTWRLKDIKDELKKRGAKVTGKKADLVKRLEFCDQNIQCGSSQSSKQGQNMVDVPAAETFHDINSSVVLPKITKQHIQSYFDRFDKNIGDAVKLYESRYLHILRSSQQGQDTFLNGYRKASMKQIRYEVNIKNFQEGFPEEANCECAAGQGNEAHSKHCHCSSGCRKHGSTENYIT